MRIGLIDIDILNKAKKNNLNVDLMKLGAYYEKNGHQVEVLHERNDIFDYDMLCVFSVINNVPKHILTHPNISMYGEYFTNKIYVPFNNDEINYEEVNYKIYDNFLRYEFISKRLSEKELQKIKKIKWARLFPNDKPINVYDLLTGEPVQLVDTYIFDKENWREVVKKLAIYSSKITFSRPQIIRNQKDFDDFVFLLNYNFVGCKGMILINDYNNFKDFIIKNQSFIKEHPTRFIYSLAYDYNNLYTEMFYLEEIENTFNKLKLLNRLGITVYETNMICYSDKSLTIGVFNALYIWSLTSNSNSMNFFRFFHAKYKNQPHLIDYFTKFINKYPKYRKLFNHTINEEE